MNTKRFLVMAVLVVLSVSLLTVAATTKPAPVKAQVQAGGSSLILMNDPAVRMQSGPIQFSDNSFPDFRSHAKTPSKPIADTGCIADEFDSLRRYGGCIEE